MNEDDEAPLDPAESLRVIERERSATARRIIPDPRLLLWPWGIAWLVGFTVYFLRFGPGGRVIVDMPEWLPLVLLLVLIFIAGTITGFVGGRAARQVSGPTSRQGRMYGWTWGLAFSGMITVLSRISELLPTAQATLLWTGTMTALTGALHMAGGAIWNDRTMFRLGAWLSVVNVVGVVLGPGWHALVVAVAGGGGMLVAGLISWLRLTHVGDGERARP
ncbi:transporter [Nucisporomicrobium flavum]|uniref:transporter n=1 Tax=Nucisporomicrobium flavum TaxID=2785915 RepID=UPI0018F65899|nr:transporter [Nucisporomicrobium flavum]